jgi:hypothetical protein
MELLTTDSLSPDCGRRPAKIDLAASLVEDDIESYSSVLPNKPAPRMASNIGCRLELLLFSFMDSYTCLLIVGKSSEKD